MDEKQQIIDTTISELTGQLEAYKPFQDLMGVHYSNLLNLISTFSDDAEHAREEERTLRLAVIGQVKSGKSSFLNAALFRGRAVLPKAATPMTAALSLIKYAPEFKVEVEFYRQEEWENVVRAAEEYEKRFAQARQRLEKRLLEKTANKKILVRDNPSTIPAVSNAAILAEAKIPEENKAAYELVDMARKNQLNVYEHLGRTEILGGIERVEDMEKRLSDYVGANGLFTPIVSSTVIHYNDPLLKDIEIVDTPGINDPVIFRSERTRNYLGKCDVVFMLSPCAHFLGQMDIEIMARYLQAKGIKDIVIIGSQIDSAMLREFHNYPNNDELHKAIKSKLLNHATDVFTRLEKDSRIPEEREMLNRLKECLPPVLISAMAFNIAQHYDDPNQEESRLLKMYNLMYPGKSYNQAELFKLSNISSVVDKLEQVRARKDSIIEGRFMELVEGTRLAVLQELSKLRQYVGNNFEMLTQADINSLQEAEKAVVSRLKQGQRGIEDAFDQSIVKIRKDLSMLQTQIRGVARDFSQVNQYTETTSESYEVSIAKWYNPFSWGRTETRTRTITYRYADIHDSINQVERFVYESEHRLKETILDIIDLPGLRARIKEATIKLFDLSDENFSVEDLILAVERAVDRITIPEVDFGNKDYTATITSQFSGGRASDSDIDLLQEAQRKAIHLVIKDFQQAVQQKTDEIARKLESVQKEFVEAMLADIQNELAQLRLQLQDKETSVKRYQLLLEQIDHDLNKRGA